MLEVNHNANFKYHRLIVDEFDEENFINLTSDFDYSFVISYGKFESKQYNVIDKNAAIINLTDGLDHAFARFNATARKHIRRFDKIEQLSFHQEIENKQAFYSFYSDAEKSRSWFPVPEDELFQSLVYYINYEGNPISGMTAYTHGNLMRLGRIFSTRNLSDLENSNLIFGVAAKKLVYEFCQYAINNGFHQLDLGGVDLTSAQKSGITEFKLSFTDKVIPVKIGRWSKTDYKILQQEFLNQGLDLT